MRVITDTILLFEVLSILTLITLIMSLLGMRPVGRTLTAVMEGLETLAFMILAILPAPRVHRAHVARHTGKALA